MMENDKEMCKEISVYEREKEQCREESQTSDKMKNITGYRDSAVYKDRGIQYMQRDMQSTK